VKYPSADGLLKFGCDHPAGMVICSKPSGHVVAPAV
jgi:hypothetical protein